ncbi:MAG: M1 family peptidase, partial [Dinghuibacter sp.]|nr:M1 family peptidase [Dinghuibacter sp.]
MRCKKIASFFILSFLLQTAAAQYWQQKIKYTMNVMVNVQTNRFTGKQLIDYWNQSPDTLKAIYFHLYWNAFQPGSMMDARSRELGKIVLPNGRNDWDNRVRDRISKLQPNEIGYQKVQSVKINGVVQKTEEYETILKVITAKPIAPGAKITMEVLFEAQVPVQIRRSGRDNAEGVRFSMSQWYPKVCEYDREGWHPTPYIAREFYGVWGDFDVSITLDKSYVVAATGYLQNPDQIGYGYEQPGVVVKRPAGNMLTWRFVAPNVHDFVWAADPEYKHISKTVRDGLVLHAFYKIAPDLLKKQFENFSARQKAQFGNNAENYVTHYRKEWEDVLELAAA